MNLHSLSEKLFCVSIWIIWGFCVGWLIAEITNPGLIRWLVVLAVSVPSASVAFITYREISR